MAKVQLTVAEVSAVAQLLYRIAARSPSLQGNAGRWAGRMALVMGRRDLQRVVWLLRRAGNADDLARQARRDARRWSAHLRART